MVRIQYDLSTNAAPYFDAVWELVHRGILRPTTAIDGQHQRPPYLSGLLFGLTAYGRKWLLVNDPVECLPTDYSRFGQLLANHSRKFGAGFHSRSQEAVGSYRARTYLACCVMCGAAAESILLALAIARRGDEAAVLKDYRGGSGRSRIENYVLSQQNGVVQETLPKYLDLLKYWRDDAAHGQAVSIGEEEAFTSLLLLMRFAGFVDERWTELSGVS
jgi:hypothetical protein